MGEENINKDLNELEKQLQEVNEWQTNANNPGHYVGNGKVPVVLKNLFRSPLVMLTVGIIIAIPTAFSLIKDFSILSITSNLVGIVISIALTAGGILRLMKRT